MLLFHTVDVLDLNVCELELLLCTEENGKRSLQGLESRLYTKQLQRITEIGENGELDSDAPEHLFSLVHNKKLATLSSCRRKEPQDGLNY